MKRVILIGLVVSSFLFSNESEIDAQKRFKQSCVVCHTDKQIDPNNKANLVGPPIDEVMMHIKEKFPKKEEAVKFMVDYILKPDPKKALCASIDKFGVMPSMEGIITPQEAVKISQYLFDNFPRDDFAKKDRKIRDNITFETIDTNKDGFITPQEFIEFRAKKNGIDPKKFKHNLFFQKIDLNKDGKMDREEFKKFRESRKKETMQ